MITRILAFVCAVCPVCALARTRAGGFIARSGFFRFYTRFCPFCRAYRRLKSSPTSGA